jgi:carbamoylphosphate synthase large subunit
MPAGRRHVLVGFAESLAAPESIWSLWDGGFRVTAFTRRGARPPIRRFRGLDVVEVDSPADDWPATVARLGDLAREIGADAVMPLDDEAVWLCARLSERSTVPVVGPVGEQAEFALDKRLQFAHARAAGFDVPQTVELDSLDVAAAAAPPLAFPLIVKRALAVAEVGPRLLRAPSTICADADEFRRAVSDFPAGQPVLLQPWLAGTGEGIFGLAGDDGLVAVSAHRRIRMVDPHGSGSSACASIRPEPELVERAEALVRRVGWRGLFMIELLRAGNRVWFVEFNGRTWGSTALARRLGKEYPAWSAEQRLLGKLPRDGIPFREVTCRHLGFEIAHTLAVLKGPRSRAIRFPPRLRTVMDVAHVRRSDTWYNLRPGARRVFVDDTFQTAFAPLLRRGRRLLGRR